MKGILLGLALLGARMVLAGDATIPGSVTTPFPTLNHLAVEWEIEGDDDLDATCEVRYRKAGSATWIDGMPLRRVPAGTSRNTRPLRTWTNRLSGSLFDLEQGTEYEIELRLQDPDGGHAVRSLKAATRAPLVASEGSPSRQAGKTALNSAVPGEVIILEDGHYGSFVFQRDGLPGRPVVYRSLTGGAVFSEISLNGRKWVCIEGLTVNGPVRMNGAEHCGVRRCVIRSQFGIKAYKPGMFNACIEDNVITGIREWRADIMGANGDNDGEGIQFTGSGNVIRHNRVSGFRDCISHMEDGEAVAQMCNDILNNDIIAGLDDGIEADFAMHNCRILRNRLVNCFVGISSQPGLGGPNYFMRNVLFNITHEAFKLHRFSIGDVVMHNTVIKAGDGLGIYTSEPFDHALIRGNLFVGGKVPDGVTYGGYSPGRGRAVDVQRFGKHCIIDGNAYAAHGLPFEGKIGSWTFHKLPGERFELHGMAVTLDVFAHPAFPENPLVLHPPPNFELKPAAPRVGAHAGESFPAQYGPRPFPSADNPDQRRGQR